MKKIQKIYLCFGTALLVMTFLTWQSHKATQNAIKWVEDIGGNVQVRYPDWMKKYPSFLESVLQKTFGGELRVKIYITSIDEIPDFSNLMHLSNMEYLMLYHPDEMDLNILNGLINLKHLYLANTETEDLSPVLVLRET